MSISLYNIQCNDWHFHFEQDGRLQSGDHILQIGDINLRGMGSEQVAQVLRQAGTHVRLIVARPVEQTSAQFHGSAAIVPTRVLSNPEEVEKHLTMFQQVRLIDLSSFRNLPKCSELAIGRGFQGRQFFSNLIIFLFSFNSSKLFSPTTTTSIETRRLS